MKMIQETRKILHDDDMKITATTVRVPVRFAHSVSANVQLERKFDLGVVKKIIQDYSGIIVKDDPEKGEYPIPQDAEGKDDVYVGRIRRDFSQENGLNLWIVSDNIRKGAATNAVQIGELLVENWEEKE